MLLDAAPTKRTAPIGSAQWYRSVTVVAVAYFAGAVVGFSLVLGTWISAIWPPSGIALAAVLLGGNRLWPGIAIGSILGNCVGLAGRGTPLWSAVIVSTFMAVGNVLQAVVGAAAVRRCGPSGGIFDRVPNVFAFVILGPLLSPIVSASIGVLTLRWSGLLPAEQFTEAWISWWLGNMMGDLVFAPLVLVWRRPRRPEGWTEPVLLAILLIATSAIAFGLLPFTHPMRYPLVYLPVPLVGWAAYRFRHFGAVTATAILALLAVYGTVHGRGAFVQGTIPESLFLLQTFVFMTAAGALILAATVTERARQEMALREAHNELERRVAERTEELRALSGRLESVREEERRHVAREIHDELGQLLTAMKIDLYWLRKRQSPSSEQRMRDVIALVDRMIGSVRRIATELRPSVLDHLGLIGSLEWLMEDFRQRSHVHCIAEIEPEELDLDPAQATEVFRIVQEAITNVARHADASEMQLSVKETDRALFIELRDNGRGIGSVAPAGDHSLGLVGMQERANRCGATLEIAGLADGGTTVRLFLPLRLVSTEEAHARPGSR